jgi:hypothetical protein
MIQQKHIHKISSDGVLKLMAQTARTQLQNKQKVQDKFIALIVETFTPEKQRKATSVPQKSIAQRLLNKKLRAKKLSERKIKFTED